MSIHPEYATAILTGTKKVEFRKRPIGSDVTHVIVYATAPVSAVVGAFTVADRAKAAPSSLWQRYAKVAGITRRRFFGYFAERSLGVGIQVGDVLAADGPLPLDTSLGVARPPQSFQYLSADIAEPALAEMHPVG